MYFEAMVDMVTWYGANDSGRQVCCREKPRSTDYFPALVSAQGTPDRSDDPGYVRAGLAGWRQRSPSAPTPVSVHTVTMRLEFIYMVETPPGMSPIDAIRTATINASETARYP